MTADDTTSAPQQDGHGETRYASKTHRERPRPPRQITAPSHRRGVFTPKKTMTDDTTSRDGNSPDSTDTDADPLSTADRMPDCCDNPMWGPLPENRFEVPGPGPRAQYYECSNCGSQL